MVSLAGSFHDICKIVPAGLVYWRNSGSTSNEWLLLAALGEACAAGADLRPAQESCPGGAPNFEVGVFLPPRTGHSKLEMAGLFLSQQPPPASVRSSYSQRLSLLLLLLIWHKGGLKLLILRNERPHPPKEKKDQWPSKLSLSAGFKENVVGFCLFSFSFFRQSRPFECHICSVSLFFPSNNLDQNADKIVPFLGDFSSLLTPWISISRLFPKP